MPNGRALWVDDTRMARQASRRNASLVPGGLRGGGGPGTSFPRARKGDPHSPWVLASLGRHPPACRSRPAQGRDNRRQSARPWRRNGARTAPAGGRGGGRTKAILKTRAGQWPLIASSPVMCGKRNATGPPSRNGSSVLTDAGLASDNLGAAGERGRGAVRHSGGFQLIGIPDHQEWDHLDNSATHLLAAAATTCRAARAPRRRDAIGAWGISGKDASRHAPNLFSLLEILMFPNPNFFQGGLTSPPPSSGLGGDVRRVSGNCC